MREVKNQVTKVIKTFNELVRNEINKKEVTKNVELLDEQLVVILLDEKNKIVDIKNKI